MYHRPMYHMLVKRLREPRRFIQVLAGPRQTGKTTDKTTDKKLSANEKAILKLIAANPAVTQKEMAVGLNLTEDGIYYHIVRLKAKGMLRRVGGKKAGRWEL